MNAVLAESNKLENDSNSKLSIRKLLFENLMSVDEIMADLGVCRSTVYSWSHQGAPFEKKHGRLYANPKKFAEWYERRNKK